MEQTNTLQIKEILRGHVSMETAYLVEDYPYGFRLRCQMKYWLDKREGYGTRLMQQSSNPKKAVLAWNKPKASTYSGGFSFLFLNEQEHVNQLAIHPNCSPSFFTRIKEDEIWALFTEEEHTQINAMLALSQKRNPVTWQYYREKMAIAAAST